MHLKPDPKTKKDVWTLASVGNFTIPSLERIELLDADGPPPANARERVDPMTARRSRTYTRPNGVPGMSAFAVALLFQVAAAGAVPAVGGPADMVSLPAGTVRVNGLAATAGNRPRLFSARTSPVEIRGPIDWEVPEAGRGVADGSPWSSFRLPAGKYVLLVEKGPLVPILKAEAEVTAGKETAITAREIEGRRLSVRIRDAAKAPVRGGRLDATGAPPFDRALVALLSKRAGAAKEDGLLDLGLVPAEEPLTLRVSAPGHRAATLKLGARFEEGRRDVVLAPNQDVEVRVAGLAGRPRRGAAGGRARPVQQSEGEVELLPEGRPEAPASQEVVHPG